MALAHGAVGWSALCDCGISLSYPFTFLSVKTIFFCYSKYCLVANVRYIALMIVSVIHLTKFLIDHF